MRLRRITSKAAAAAAIAIFAGGAGAAIATFTDSSDNPQTVSAVADFLAPTVNTSAIAKTSGYSPGYVKQGGTYYVYANVGDTGNPASGINTVRADVSAVTTGQSAVTMTTTGCPCVVAGTSFTHRSAQLTATNPLTAGTKAYTIATTDTAGNSTTKTDLSVVVDNTTPTGTDIQTANVSGGTSGQAAAGDSITYTFSEPMDPSSILASWTGTSTGVVVRLDNNSTCISGSMDRVTVYNSTNATQLNLGCINLGRSDYTSTSRTFGASGTASAMVMSGSTITITLGTRSGATTTAAAATAMTWSPSASAFDRAANAMSTATVTETGASDKEF